jgi:DNA replication protein DnaC
MRLTGMAKALTEQMEMQDLNSLTFDERLGLMVDREMLDREDRRLATRLRKAKLRVAACMEDIDFRHKRGLDKSLVMSLAGCQWITGRQNLIITGPTGVGKTYLACALVHKYVMSQAHFWLGASALKSCSSRLGATGRS